MKKRMFKLVFITALLLLSSSVSAFGNQYDFESGGNSLNTFGKSTSNDDPVVVNSQTTNIRRNKDSALFPPSYGVFSGNIPTNETSLYHNNDLGSMTGNGGFGGLANSYSGSSGFGEIAGSNTSIGSSSMGGMSNMSGMSSSIANANLPDGMLPSTSVTYSNTEVTNTIAWAYEDGSIGSLYIPKIKKTLKVFEGETLENMKKGIGHFESTSAWDGNIALAGHNRGATGYFGFVKDLQNGDKITYTTQYGVRTYEIYFKEKISDTDYTSLTWTPDNIITMITCVENSPNLRWCVQAREVK